VFTDITQAIEIGIIISALFFMHRMAETVGIRQHREDTVPPDQERFDAALTNNDYVVFRILGPFFFGAASKVIQTMEDTGISPRAYVLDFSEVPFVDSTAMAALTGFASKARKSGSRLIIAGAAPALSTKLTTMNGELSGMEHAASVASAVASLHRAASQA